MFHDQPLVLIVIEPVNTFFQLYNAKYSSRSKHNNGNTQLKLNIECINSKQTYMFVYKSINNKFIEYVCSARLINYIRYIQHSQYALWTSLLSSWYILQQSVTQWVAGNMQLAEYIGGMTWLSIK